MVYYISLFLLLLISYICAYDKEKPRGCICQNINRNDPDLEPHFTGRKPHRFQIKDNPFFTLCRSELLCRKSRLTVSISVEGWWPGSSFRGYLPVLPDYCAHRGLLSSGLWNKCERTGQTTRRVPNKVQCGSCSGRYSGLSLGYAALTFYCNCLIIIYLNNALVYDFSF